MTEASAAAPFGVRIRQQRLAAGMTLGQLAARVDVNPRYLRRLETGDRQHPSDDLLRRIAAALDIDPGALTAPADGPKPPTTSNGEEPASDRGAQGRQPYEALRST